MQTRRRVLIGTVLAAAAARSGSVAAAGGDDPRAALRRIEVATGGRLGVAVRETGSGRRLDYRAEERFPLCSTAKLLACATLLARVDAGRDRLEDVVRVPKASLVTYSPATTPRADGPGMTLRELCAAAMTLSDNTAMNLILARIGGPTAVTAFVRALGDRVTRLDRTELALNQGTPGDERDTTSPAAMAGTLEALVLGSALSQPLRTQLDAWLGANTTGNAKLRAGVPEGWRVGDKTGAGGHGTSNDVAVLRPPTRPPLIAAVYLTGAETVDESARSAAQAAVARVLASFFG